MARRLPSSELFGDEIKEPPVIQFVNETLTFRSLDLDGAIVFGSRAYDQA